MIRLIQIGLFLSSKSELWKVSSNISLVILNDTKPRTNKTSDNEVDFITL